MSAKFVVKILIQRILSTDQTAAYITAGKQREIIINAQENPAKHRNDKTIGTWKFCSGVINKLHSLQ